jgi:NAD-dependent dihydropyrimidine dehydrogenase PreA subunit
MAKRKIIEIDRDKCNGCGLCTTACAEGALVLDAENKAVLVREIFCDGLGACLDVCPADALKVVERESDGYDSRAAFDHVLKTRGAAAASRVHGVGAGHAHAGHSGCPGSLARTIPCAPGSEEAGPAVSAKSRLSQWPIQLHLVSPQAPYFEGSDLLVAADCTAFALGGFHDDLLKGKKLVIACPKLDETQGYVEKLAELIKGNGLKSLTVAIMTVPCCSGLERIVRQAVELSGEPLEVKKVVVGIDGRVDPAVGPDGGGKVLQAASTRK